MVVIYTNENNPATLKLVACLKYAKKSAEIKIINPTDKSLPAPGHLPYIVLNEERILFSSNAIAQYFFPCAQDDEELVRRWLEFDSVELAPCLALALGGSSRSPAIKNALANTLKTLNDILKDKPLNQKSVTVCDIALWSTLYSLCADDGLSKEYLDSHPNIIGWVKKIGAELNLQEALTEFKIPAGSPAYTALFLGSKFPANITFAESPNSPHSTSEHATPEEINAAKLAWNKSLDKLEKPKTYEYPVLPYAGEKNILITSALPYVNNIPHLGNIIGCVLSADVFARFSRLCNWNTLYIGGTDEYGTATETKALEEGLTPQEICDKYFDIHNNIYRWFNIGFDYFGRTTTEQQTKLVQSMFLEVNANGFMQTQPVEQLLCEKCNRYLADRFVEGGCPHPGCNYEDARGDQCDLCGKLVNAAELKNPRCKVCRSTPVPRTSSQFFLDLPKLEPLLRHWMEKSVPGWTNNAKVISKAWLREGLKARCITRDLKWGIPVPIDGYRDKVFYVWFDAPLGYISMTERYSKEWKQWWQPSSGTDVKLYQFMAKDNVPFHSVMFPACLLGANKGYTLVSHIMATEYLNYEDGKFSKSRGVGVFGNDAKDTGIASDVWRFYLLYVRPEGQDSSFSWVDLATKNNSELLNNLGNFINRALVFTEKFFNSIVPNMNPTDDDYAVLALCTRELKKYVVDLEKGKLRDGIRHILAISKHGNQYMQLMQPWVLLKGSDEERLRAGTVIGICVNISCLLSTLIQPYMPETSRTLKEQLNAPASASIINAENPEILNLLRAGHKIGRPAPLFMKIEPAFVEEMKQKYSGSQASTSNEQNSVSSSKSSIISKNSSRSNEEASGSASAANGIASPEEIKKLEAEVENQGLVVRKLKESGAAKAEWAPQVDLLLQLKGKLAVASGKPLAAPGKGKKGKK